MKSQKIILIIFLSFFVYSCSNKNNSKIINLSENCSIEYIIDSDKNVTEIEICNGNETFQITFQNDYSPFVYNNGDNLSCQINSSNDQLYSYCIQHKNSNFQGIVNLLDSGDSCFEISTSSYKEVSNNYGNAENRITKQLFFNNKESYIFYINKDGTFENEYINSVSE